MVVQQNSSTILTRWYMGNSYTKEDAAGVVKEFTYIGGDAYTAPVLGVTQSGSTTYYYLLRDHLGSITHIVNTSNSIVAEYSYDVWGRMRDKTTWVAYSPGSEPSLFSGRGFTGHEHLPWFKMINMNGRLYDPLTGQFLSPDPYVQNPSLTQSLNRYLYCLNNPLKYTDPSGFTLDELMYQTYWGSYNYWIESNAGKIQSGGYRNYREFKDGKSTITFTRKLDGSTVISYCYEDKATTDYYKYANSSLELVAAKGESMTWGGQLVYNALGGQWSAQGGGGETFNNIISTANQIGEWGSIGLFGPQLATDPKLNIKSRYQPRNYKPAVEAQVSRGMKTAYKYLDYGGKVLGVVSAVDHYNKAYQNYQNDNVWAAIGYGALSTLDVALMFVKTTNPFILAGIMVYNVVDATAF